MGRGRSSAAKVGSRPTTKAIPIDKIKDKAKPSVQAAGGNAGPKPPRAYKSEADAQGRAIAQGKADHPDRPISGAAQKAASNRARKSAKLEKRLEANRNRLAAKKAKAQAKAKAEKAKAKAKAKAKKPKKGGGSSGGGGGTAKPSRVQTAARRRSGRKPASNQATLF